MGQGGSKELSGSRQRKGEPYWHSLVSSSRASTSSYNSRASRDSYPALIPCQHSDNTEAKVDEAVPNRFSRVLGYIKKKITRKESSFSQKTTTSTTEIPDEVLEIPQPCQAVKGLDELVMCTNFSREELQLMYHGFKNDCPAGVIDRDTFKELYVDLFPAGDSASYAHFIFNTFDTNKDGMINFEDFAVGLSESLHGSLHDKLKWTFRLYDVDSDGLLRKEELIEVFDAVYRINLSPSLEEVPESSMFIGGDPSIGQHIGQLYEALDKNNNGVVTEDDFVDACLADKSLLRSLAIANQFDDLLEDIQEEMDLSLSVDCSSKSSFGLQDSLPRDLSPRTSCQNLNIAGHDRIRQEEGPNAMSGDVELFEIRNERSYSCA